MEFNSEKCGGKNLNAMKLSPIFFCNLYSLHFMPDNDVKRFDWSKHLTSFSAMKDGNHTYFSVNPSHSSFCHRICQNSINPNQSYFDLFVFFQPVALDMRIGTLNLPRYPSLTPQDI